MIYGGKHARCTNRRRRRIYCRCGTGWVVSSAGFCSLSSTVSRIRNKNLLLLLLLFCAKAGCVVVLWPPTKKNKKTKFMASGPSWFLFSASGRKINFPLGGFKNSNFERLLPSLNSVPGTLKGRRQLFLRGNRGCGASCRNWNWSGKMCVRLLLSLLIIARVPTEAPISQMFNPQKTSKTPQYFF